MFAIYEAQCPLDITELEEVGLDASPASCCMFIVDGRGGMDLDVNL